LRARAGTARAAAAGAAHRPAIPPEGVRFRFPVFVLIGSSSMSRLQNLLLLIWFLFLLLLALFNWPLVSRTETIGFLFMKFDLAWGLWLVVLGIAVPALIRLIGWSEAHSLSRRTSSELTRLKAKAFDERSGELESFAKTLQERLESSIRSLMGSGGGDAPKP